MKIVKDIKSNLVVRFEVYQVYISKAQVKIHILPNVNIEAPEMMITQRHLFKFHNLHLFSKILTPPDDVLVSFSFLQQVSRSNPEIEILEGIKMIITFL